MATEYDDTNTGAMFVNDRKTSDRHPDRSGNALIKCPHCEEITDYWVSGWIKTAKRTGQKFLSMAFTKKEQRASPAPTSADSDSSYDDDIPF